MSVQRLDNRTARRLFLDRHALLEAPSGPGKGEDLLDLITRLGFVQVDSIRTVERAHHMILHSRRTAYRPPALERLVEKDRALFEHWTHDAAIIPMAFYPYWQLRFARDRERLGERWRKWHGDGFDREFETVLEHIRANGVASTSDVGVDESRKSGQLWGWNPSKIALEYLWRTGALAVCHRENFRKHYDLADRIIPPEHYQSAPDEAETVNWAASAALERLGFATSGELAAFWGKIRPDEAKLWVQKSLKSGDIEEIEVESSDGSFRRALARPETVAAAKKLGDAPGMMRILSPFDPMIRNRDRCERLFNFFYRIEIFVPEAKRQYGYYVFPLLEGDALVGRIDMKAQGGKLNVAALWPEPGVKFGKSRMSRLEAALDRTSRLAGAETISFAKDYLKNA